MTIKKYIDTKLIKILAAFYALVEILGFLKWYYFFDIDIYKESGISNSSLAKTIFYNFVLDWFFVMVFMVMISAFAKQLQEKLNFKTSIILHIILSFVIGWFVFAFHSLTLFISGQMGLSEALSNITINRFMYNLVPNFLIYFSMIGIIYIYYYVKKIKKIEDQKSKLSIELNEAKIKSLKAQLHPHFLFNTLNSISALIDIDKKQAQNTIADLGYLLREIVDLKNDNLIPITHELQLLQKYLDIKLLRFSDHLTINSSVDEKVMNMLIPNLLLQPILENSFKHGYSYNNTDLDVDFSIKSKNNKINIIIKNNGEPLSKPFKKLKKSGTGLSNTIDRLKTIYGNKFTFEMKNLPDAKGVVTEINIPILKVEKQLASK